jgi:hypothetical protein
MVEREKKTGNAHTEKKRMSHEISNSRLFHPKILVWATDLFQVLFCLDLENVGLFRSEVEDTVTEYLL